MPFVIDPKVYVSRVSSFFQPIGVYKAQHQIAGLRLDLFLECHVVIHGCVPDS
jgi:hypothetical protein